MKTPTRVFISHSADDTTFARELARELSELGFQATEWEPPSGPKVEEALHEAIAKASAYIVLISDHALQSPWLHFELGAAMASRRTLVPVYLADKEHVPVPFSLSSVQGIRAVALRPEEVAEQVAKALGHAKERGSAL